MELNSLKWKHIIKLFYTLKMEAIYKMYTYFRMFMYNIYTHVDLEKT